MLQAACAAYEHPPPRSNIHPIKLPAFTHKSTSHLRVDLYCCSTFSTFNGARLKQLQKMMNSVVNKSKLNITYRAPTMQIESFTYTSIFKLCHHHVNRSTMPND